MTGFLQKLQKGSSVAHPTSSDATTVVQGGSRLNGNGHRKAPTSILLTSREPSAEGLLAELLGARASTLKGDVRSLLEQSNRPRGGARLPWWIDGTHHSSQNLDRLVPSARLILHESWSGSTSGVDLTTAVKRAVSTAARTLSDEIRFTSRDLQDATQELMGLISGKGPLQELYDDPYVTDIFIDGFDKIRCLRLGHALETPFKFRTPADLEAFCSAILGSVNRTLDARSPVVDCVLRDQWRSRVNATHGSIRESGESSLVIRVPRLPYATLYDLLRFQTMPTPVAAWLAELVSFAQTNILVLGPTSSGKTTLVSALLSAVGSDERICTIEDVPEIFVANCHIEKLVTRVPDSHGEGRVSSEELMQAALHRAPHRIVIGEITDVEGALFVKALESGHFGSMATMHSDSAVEGLWHLLGLISSVDKTPLEVLKRQIARSINVIILMKRIDGQPCIVDISEVVDTQGKDFEVKQLIRYEGDIKGRRVWRKLTDESRLLNSLADRGVELPTSRTLLPPATPGDTFAISES